MLQQHKMSVIYTSINLLYASTQPVQYLNPMCEIAFPIKNSGSLIDGFYQNIIDVSL